MPAERLPPVPRRLDAIDGLRGIAALAVFFFHLNVAPLAAAGWLASGWHAVWRYGHLGVPLFFVLSGVCIGRTWLRGAGAKEFLWHRLRRIFPAYWGSLIVTLLLAGAVKLATGVNDVAMVPTSAGTILATLSLATAPVTTVPPMSWVYWSLSYALAFYAVMAGLLLAFPGRRAAALACAHVGLCALAMVPSGWPSPAGFWVDLWPLFGTGAAIALWPTHRRLVPVMLAASGAHAVVALAQHRLQAYWAVALVGAVSAAWALHRGRPAWPRVLVRIGERSYSIYLLHSALGVYVFNKLIPSFGAFAALEILRQLLIVALTVVTVRPFFAALERPFLRRAAPPAGNAASALGRGLEPAANQP